MQITYRFILADGKEESFAMGFDPATMAYVPPAAAAAPPEWARLENNKCRHCPLKEADSPHCPVAVNLAPVIAKFVDHISFEEVEVVVVTSTREYRKRFSLQRGIAAIFGLIMATSGCPVLDKLRPMAFTHLPMSDLAETRYRAITMYLLAQYLRKRKGLPADLEVKGLEEVYAAVGILNQDFIKRLRTIDMQDANFNALAGLDCFCLGDPSIMSHSLDKIEKIFQSYL
jgi:hypothetical protein